MDEIILHIRLRRAQPDMEVASGYGGIGVVQSLSTDRRGNGLRRLSLTWRWHPAMEVSVSSRACRRIDAGTGFDGLSLTWRCHPAMEVASCYGGIGVIQSLSKDRHRTGFDGFSLTWRCHPAMELSVSSRACRRMDAGTGFDGLSLTWRWHPAMEASVSSRACRRIDAGTGFDRLRLT
ncbi:hypothetical protein BC792_101229 [Sphingobacterium allocomposti]|uniref:Uncharacterized protein n=1 Tax=Sphingobacterium allocomposti TaxID=415956 RepID=A0A5S5DRQ2_9SPHI|nr:hypothetical protein [Sphingobacterium composti Yoo et al. 2007 non Ten et al. 2007]TYP98571.1 hypothetical protein BC792_101229 [Sphingobacterium composti Yoo et al. 2007 non Ten et al. 2007]